MLSSVTGLIPNGESSRTNEPVMFYADNQTWDKKTLKQLKDEYNVIFNGGIMAFMVLNGGTGHPLIAVGHEDDGVIWFDRRYGQFAECFSTYWIDSVIACLRSTQQFAKGAAI